MENIVLLTIAAIALWCGVGTIGMLKGLCQIPGGQFMTCTVLAVTAIIAVTAVFVIKVLPALGNNEPRGRHPS